MEDREFSLIILRTPAGREPFSEWFEKLDIKIRAVVARRVGRLRLGLFGDLRSLGGSLFELRIHLGPGYRIYAASPSKNLVVIIYGGLKRDQVKDIRRARELWKAYEAKR